MALPPEKITVIDDGPPAPENFILNPRFDIPENRVPRKYHDHCQDPQCPAKIEHPDNDDIRWLCSRPKGHNGAHEAAGYNEKAGARWTDAYKMALEV